MNTTRGWTPRAKASRPSRLTRPPRPPQTIQGAYEAGITRQRVRVLLTRNPNLYADRGDLDNPVARGFQATGTLVPPDEQWQGGIMELYYAITPGTQNPHLPAIPHPVTHPPPPLHHQW